MNIAEILKDAPKGTKLYSPIHGMITSTITINTKFMETKQTSNIDVTTDYIGKKVVVRGTNSGVFFGTLAERDGQEVRLTDVRRLWYWDGAASDFQLAAEGVKNPSECKFTMTIGEITVLDAIEILPCAKEAIQSLSSVAVWKR